MSCYNCEECAVCGGVTMSDLRADLAEARKLAEEWRDHAILFDPNAPADVLPWEVEK